MPAIFLFTPVFSDVKFVDFKKLFCDVNNLPLDNCPISCYIIYMITNDPNTHPNADLDKSHPLRDMLEVQPEEQPFDGWEGCWAGDGSGMDDLADFNQMEGDDY